MAEKLRPNTAGSKGYRRSLEAAKVELENLEKNDNAILKYMNSVGAPVSAMQLMKNVDGIRKVESFCFSDETDAEILELTSSQELAHQSGIADKAFAIHASLERLIIKDQIAIQDANGTHLYALTHAGVQKTEENDARGLYTRRT